MSQSCMRITTITPLNYTNKLNVINPLILMDFPIHIDTKIMVQNHGLVIFVF